MFGHSSAKSIYKRVTAPLQLLALIVFCSLGGCASIGLGGSDTAADQLTTGSIGAGDTLLAGIDTSDWEILLGVISSFDKGDMGDKGASGEWLNPQTGSKGRITQVKLLPSLVDEECRTFKSSMHRVTGVENIEGQICKPEGGSWQIIGFASGVSA